MRRRHHCDTARLANVLDRAYKAMDSLKSLAVEQGIGALVAVDDAIKATVANDQTGAKNCIGQAQRLSALAERAAKPHKTCCAGPIVIIAASKDGRDNGATDASALFGTPDVNGRFAELWWAEIERKAKERKAS